MVARHGRIDVLVNNAGGQFPQHAELYSTNGWNAVIATNLNGTWYVTQAVGRRMIAGGGGGRIVNVIANHHRGIPGAAHTSAARARGCQPDQDAGDRVGRPRHSLERRRPAPIASSGFDRTYDAAVVERARSLPLGRLGTVDEVAAAVVFLASPASSWITGATLDVTGGQHLYGETWVVDPNAR